MTAETKGNPILQYLAAASASFAIICDGMHYGWPANSIPQLTNNQTCMANVCISDDDGAWLASMPLLGDIVGSILAASVVDILGRKKTILTTAPPLFIAWILIVFAKSPMYFFLARFLAGIADGIVFTAVPMYMGEIADAHIRGLLASSCSFMWIFGFLLINLISPYFSITYTALVSSVVPLIFLLTFSWMPESPYYLLMRKRPEAARDAMKALKGVKNVDEDIYRMSMAMEEEANSKSGGKFTDLFTVSSNRKAVIITIGLRGFQQLSGTTAIAFYTYEIFESSGDVLSPHHAVMMYFLIQLITTVLSGFLVDKTGRKPLLLISITGAALALFLEGTYFYLHTQTPIDTKPFSFLPIVGLLSFVMMFSIGMQSVPICMLAEMYPTNVKALALCIADVYFSLMATVASKYLQKSKAMYGFYASFYGFAICSVFGLVFILLCIPETKGKTLEEIQMSLKGRSKKQDDAQ